MLMALCNIHPFHHLMTPPTLGPRGAVEGCDQTKKCIYNNQDVLFFHLMQQMDLD